jgi:hypothetical protein
MLRTPIPLLKSRNLFHVAVGIAVASLGLVGVARADTDNIANTSNVPVVGHSMACAQVATPANTSWTPSAFSFDISWVDRANRAYYLADRSHNGVTASNGGNGDVMVIDINSVNLRSANTQLPDAGNSEGFYMLPPAADPMAGIVCDQNANFGGTTGVGRNELTGPNGAFTVNHSEVWVGDGPGKFQPTQFDTTPVLTNGNGTTITSCASAGAVCTYPGKASDYAADPCNSSVRVFDLISRQQTDHINVHGCFRTDEGAFDPDDQIAVFANPSEQSSLNGVATAFTNVAHSPFLTFISTVPKAGGPTTMNAHPILKQINFDGTNGTVLADGGIEQSVYSNKTGRFYVAVPATTANPNGFVSVIDPGHRDGDHRDGDHDGDDIHVERNIALTGGCSPNGAALGPDYELALFCSSAPIQVIDIRSGHLIKSVAGTAGGCDEGYFNAGDDHFVGACTDNNPGQDNLDIVDADPVQFDTAINTHTRGAHSVASDAVTVTDWQPAAAGTGGNAGGLCGANPCVLIYKSTGGDDPSEHQQELAEDGHER